MKHLDRYDVLNNETIYKKSKTYWDKMIHFMEIYNLKNS